jgi:hypothetical protein
MGIWCSKDRHKEGTLGVVNPRSHRFGRRRVSKQSIVFDGPPTLLDSCVAALARNIQRLDPQALLHLCPDLAQLILDRLIDTELLNEGTVARLVSQQQHFHLLDLEAYSGLTPDSVACLCSESLERLVLSKTAVSACTCVVIEGGWDFFHSFDCIVQALHGPSNMHSCLAG